MEVLTTATLVPKNSAIAILMKVFFICTLLVTALRNASMGEPAY